MWELILTATGLAADAFSLSLCKGLASPKITARHMLTAGLYFGILQAVMPVFGYLLGEKCKHAIESIDHWVAFFLLFGIGIGMLIESFQKNGQTLDESFAAKTMLPLAFSASIDALAVGITFSIEKTDIRLAAILIGIITAMLCAIGTRLGNLFGKKYSASAQRLGASALFLIGTKILATHLIQ